MESLLRTGWNFLKKLRTELPYDLATSLLSIYLKKNVIQKDTPIMFTRALFIIAKTRKQLKNPSMDD